MSLLQNLFDNVLPRSNKRPSQGPRPFASDLNPESASQTISAYGSTAINSLASVPENLMNQSFAQVKNSTYGWGQIADVNFGYGHLPGQRIGANISLPELFDAINDPNATIENGIKFFKGQYEGAMKIRNVVNMSRKLTGLKGRLLHKSGGDIFNSGQQVRVDGRDMDIKDAFYRMINHPTSAMKSKNLEAVTNILQSGNKHDKRLAKSLHKSTTVSGGLKSTIDVLGLGPVGSTLGQNIVNGNFLAQLAGGRAGILKLSTGAGGLFEDYKTNPKGKVIYNRGDYGGIQGGIWKGTFKRFAGAAYLAHPVTWVKTIMNGDGYKMLGEIIPGLNNIKAYQQFATKFNVNYAVNRLQHLTGLKKAALNSKGDLIEVGIADNLRKLGLEKALAIGKLAGLKEEALQRLIDEAGKLGLPGAVKYSIQRGVRKAAEKVIQAVTAKLGEAAVAKVISGVFAFIVGNIVAPVIGWVIAIPISRLLTKVLWSIAEVFLKATMLLIMIVGLGVCVLTDRVMGLTGFNEIPVLTPGYNLSFSATDTEPIGTSGPRPAVGGGQFSGTYSGPLQDIYAQVQAEMGINTPLSLVDCAGADCGSSGCTSICGSQGAGCGCPSGAWCYAGVNSIYCRDSKLSQASDSYVTALFRHELSHRLQAQNAGTWPSWGTNTRSNVTEWGAEHISGNGGSYCFDTTQGTMSGTGITSYLQSQGCSNSLINRAAEADYNALGEMEGSCGISPKTLITGRSIGGGC